MNLKIKVDSTPLGNCKSRQINSHKKLITRLNYNTATTATAGIYNIVFNSWPSWILISIQNVDEHVENLEDAEKEAAAKAQAEKEAAEKAVKEAAVKEDAVKAQAEKEAAEKVVKEAAEKEAAAKKLAEKEAAEKAVKEAAAKEAAAKELAEKEVAEKTVKEAAVKEDTVKAPVEKEDAEKFVKEAASKEAATKAQADKEAAEKIAKKEAKKKQEAEKEQQALKLKAEQEKANKEAEKKRKAAAKELNEKRAKEKAEKEAAKLAEIPEYESPSVQEKPFGTGKEIAEASMENEKKQGKRIVKPSIYLQSLYNNKMSNVTDPLTEDETLLAHSLLSMEGYILLVPLYSMDSEVCWKFQCYQRLRRRKKNLNAQIQVLKNIINKDETSCKLRDVKLVFFPIIAHGHYYVTVFDLDKGHAKEMLVHYLYVTKHPTLNKLVKETQPKIPKMKWKTKKNKIDCGLYMMMHMEMFEGEIGLKWKTNIVDENNRHYENMIKTMRMRYAAKILLHDVNKNREKMSEFAIKFGEQHNDQEKQKKMVEEAIKRKAAEDK
ncbi:hypothetical protein CTI12_AA073630 [Artemisia annua]|uniref:Ubiquitin-like protease family profile domain-containing protein n=1 Tax=Artemisia annua TaxID=35608 RepID=A0A2U1Q5A5_ARTAN|nr:hypothetical protein CTI12_AA073630 [Artemisia annua]